MAADELPPLPETDQIGGNEMEGIVVRALRTYETGKDAASRGEAKEAPPLGLRSSPPSPTSAPPPTSNASS